MDQSLGTQYQKNLILFNPYYIFDRGFLRDVLRGLIIFLHQLHVFLLLVYFYFFNDSFSVGMCGEALCKRGANRKITGMDISQKSLDVAAKRDCYEKLIKADLMVKLPLPSNAFDFLMCVGTTTYLGGF